MRSREPVLTGDPDWGLSATGAQRRIFIRVYQGLQCRFYMQELACEDEDDVDLGLAAFREVDNVTPREGP